jgi:hypothetical protein
MAPGCGLSPQKKIVDIVLANGPEFYHKGGTSFWSDSSFTLVPDDNLRPFGILGEGHDSRGA